MMKTFERSVFEEEIMRIATTTDEATFSKIGQLAKEARAFLASKNIETSEVHSYALLIAAVLCQNCFPIGKIFRRSISGGKSSSKPKNRRSKGRSARTPDATQKPK